MEIIIKFLPLLLLLMTLSFGLFGLTACSEKEVENPTVTLTIKGKGDIVLELYPDKAPETVANFVSLVEDGFYDGLTFHRIIPGFMIQGGDPDGTGMGGPGHNIVGEFSGNGFMDNDIVHERGVISMARSQHPDSAGSQFFIMHDKAPHLDGSYAAFGKTIKGIEIVDEIVKVDTDMRDYPSEPQVIKKAKVKLPEGYEKP